MAVQNNGDALTKEVCHTCTARLVSRFSASTLLLTQSHAHLQELEALQQQSAQLAEKLQSVGSNVQRAQKGGCLVPIPALVVIALDLSVRPRT